MLICEVLCSIIEKPQRHTPLKANEMTNIDSRSFRTSVCQAVVYTPKLDHSVSKVMSTFYPRIASYFDGDPEVLPIPAGFPAEIPRVVLKNKRESERLEISAARINYLHLMKRHDESNIDTIQFYAEAVKLFNLFIDVNDCIVGRLAAVRNVYAIYDNPGFFLARHFCKDSWSTAPLNRPENFEIHAHKIFKLPDQLDVNSWARAKTGNLSAEDKHARIILFEQDINTLSEEAEKRVFSRDEIARFFDNSSKELDRILYLYFPVADGAKS